jgi:hypothetical protein
MVDELSQVDGLIRQIRMRHLWGETRAFLKREGVKVGVGWQGMADGLREAKKTDPAWRDMKVKFETFLRDAVAVSYKRAFVLNAKPADLDDFAAKRLPSLKAGARTDFLSAETPDRADVGAASGNFAYQLEELKRGRAKVYTFVTHRPFKRNEELKHSELKQTVRSKYRSATLVAKFEYKARCYDHLVLFPGTGASARAILLIDAPPGIDLAYVNYDEARYTELLKEHLGLDEDTPAFVDLFAAVGKLWHAQGEGLVNWLGFISNKGAELVGKLNKKSTFDYRNHPFQKAGEAKAQVTPFKLQLRWMRMDNPMVLLPGTKYMVYAGGGTDGGDGDGGNATDGNVGEGGGATDGNASSGDGGVLRTQALLNHMEFPLYMEWAGFVFALDRVLQHI